LLSLICNQIACSPTRCQVFPKTYLEYENQDCATVETIQIFGCALILIIYGIAAFLMSSIVQYGFIGVPPFIHVRFHETHAIIELPLLSLLCNSSPFSPTLFLGSKCIYQIFPFGSHILTCYSIQVN
ncbi:MAG: hypothetical protein MJE68_01150, partial [Proteobacteria bacterium]|nr:hypothetical protein [Pseudomonadota bacterium]